MAKQKLVILTEVLVTEVPFGRPDSSMESSNLKKLVIHGARKTRKGWMIVISYVVSERVTGREIPMENKSFGLQQRSDGKLWAYVDINPFGDFRAVMFT